MTKKNIFISHRWGYDYTDDYTQIISAIDRSKYDVSDRSIEETNKLPGTKQEVTAAIYGKIDSASIILAPARPAATKENSMGRKEIEYALKKAKKIIAVKTSAIDSVSTFWNENDIPIVACRKDSLENEIG